MSSANWTDRHPVSGNMHAGYSRLDPEQIRQAAATPEERERLKDLTIRSSEVLTADDKQDEVLFNDVPPGGVIVVPNVLSTARIPDLISDEMRPQLGQIIRRVLAEADKPDSQ